MNALIPEKPQILGKQLQAAREGLALSVEDVSTELGIDPHALIEWENQDSQPSVKDLWLLADLYGRSTDYFLSPTARMPGQISFRLTKWRSLADLPLDAKRVLARFEEVCRTATRLEEITGEHRHIQISVRNDVRDPATLARSERSRLGLDDKPAKDLRDRLSVQGVWVFELPVPGGEFAGFSWWHPEYGPCILVNAKDISGRRLFTLAHEYAHLLRASGPTLCELWVSSSEERFADGFAAAFLMPDGNVVREFHRRGISSVTPAIQQLQSLAGKYGVSSEAMIRKLGELRLFSRETVGTLLQTGEPKPGHLRQPRTPSWRRRLGERYVVLATQAHASGHISLGKLAQLLDIDIRKARDVSRQPSSSSKGDV